MRWIVQSSKLVQVYAMCSLQGRIHFVSVCNFLELNLLNSIDPSQLMYLIRWFSSDDASVLGLLTETEVSPLSNLDFFTGDTKLSQLCIPSPWPFSTVLTLEPAEGMLQFGGVCSWLSSSRAHLGTICCSLFLEWFWNFLSSSFKCT